MDDVVARDAPRLRRDGVSLSTVVGSVVVVFGGLLVGLGQLSDNSFLTHLATGGLILDDGIPRADPYSFTATGERWVVQSWLASLIYAWLDRGFGGEAIVLLVGFSAVAIACGVWVLTRPAGTLIPRLLLGALVVAGGGGYLVERPLLFGLLGLVLVLLAAEEHISPAWLLPAGWVWVNTHGSFPVGLALVVVLALGRRLDGHKPSAELRTLRWLAGGIALGALNPLGPRLLIFPVQLLSRNEQLRAVVEWQAPQFTNIYERVFLILIVLAVLALARRPSWRAALPLALFTAAALVSARNIPVASLALVPGAARGLSGLGTITGSERRPALWFGVAAALAAAGVMLVTTLAKPAYKLDAYPVAAVDWLEQRGLTHSPLHLATQDFVGNYLEFRFVGKLPVLIDDRVDMFPASVVADYGKLLGGTAGWSEVLDRRDVDAVLWQSRRPLGQLVSEADEWRVIYRDDEWLVACRSRATSRPCG